MCDYPNQVLEEEGSSTKVQYNEEIKMILRGEIPKTKQVLECTGGFTLEGCFLGFKVVFYPRANIWQRSPFTCDNAPVGSASLEEYLRAYKSARGGVCSAGYENAGSGGCKPLPPSNTSFLLLNLCGATVRDGIPPKPHPSLLHPLAVLDRNRHR